MNKREYACPVDAVLSIINGKWKLLIIKELLYGKRRFSELQRAVAGITQKMLTKQLRELEHDDLIKRKVYPQVPPKVEYSLTSVGKSLNSVLDVMHKWGENYIQKSSKT